MFSRTLLIAIDVFLRCLHYLPLEKGETVRLNKLEPTSPNQKFKCYHFLVYCYYIILLGILLLYVINHLNKLEFPSSKDACAEFD